ncbi:MAG: MerR family transcriptional regulator [Thermodesulfobacteriota bacterium]
MESSTRWLRIGQLEKLSGVSRRTIHFYLKEGLLPPPMKTGKTMSYYDETHLKRLFAIAEAKEKGLPLFAIREELSRMEENAGKAFAAAAAGKKGMPKSAQGLKTREAVLELGCRLFRQKGFQNTKISDITRRLKVGKGTFYFYFTDKKELFLECVPRIFTELFSVGWEKISRETDPIRRLILRGELVFPVLSEFCSILALAREAMEDPDPKISKLGHDIYQSIRYPLESDIRKGLEGGLFRPIVPRVYASMIIGAIEELYHLSRHENFLEISDLSCALYDMFSLGLTGSERSWRRNSASGSAG